MAKEKIEYPSEYNNNYTDKDKQHVCNIIDWMNASEKRTGRLLAKSIGRSDAYISTLIKGKIATRAADLIKLVLPVIEDSVRDHKPGEFIKTSIYNIVSFACAKAAEHGMFSILAGAPGVGKTQSLLHYREQKPNTLYICGSEVINGTAVIDMLLAELNIRNIGKLRKSMKVDKICEALFESGRLIILDEADKCQADTPDPLRTISDRTGCGVVLAGNISLRNDVIEGKARYDLIESRVIFWPKPLNHIDKDDVKLLLRPYLPDSILTKDETFEEIAKYAGEVCEGSARKLVRSLVPNLLTLHKHADKTASGYTGISRQMIRKVAKDFMGLHQPPPVPRRESAVSV